MEGGEGWTKSVGRRGAAAQPTPERTYEESMDATHHRSVWSRPVVAAVMALAAADEEVEEKEGVGVEEGEDY